jgi:PKD repeat protein
MNLRVILPLLIIFVGILTGCDAKTIEPAQIVQPPAAAFDYSPDLPNQGEMVSFLAMQDVDGFSQPDRFIWEFGDGSSAEGRNVTHTFRDSGTFKITLTTFSIAGAESRLHKSIVIKQTVVLTPDFPYTFGAGLRRVGSEIEPGLYRSRSGGRDCRWERLSGFDGFSDQVIAWGTNDGPIIVEISGQDRAFNSVGCSRWTKDTSPITSDLEAPFGEGVFAVGEDIAPGFWQSEDTGRCYWTRLSGFSWLESEIMDEAFVRDTPVTVLIQSGDTGFMSSECGTWTRIEG